MSHLTQLTRAITATRLGQAAALALGFELFFLVISLAQMLLSPHETQFIGRDFVAFWSAAKLGLDGNALGSFLPEVIGPIQRAAVDIEGTLLWHYPPTMHLTILPLGLGDYAAALFVFTFLGISAILVCAVQTEPEANLFEKVLFVASPVVFLNFVQGQNGAFIALFLVMFLRSLERGYWRRAGFWSALLLVKPHLALMIPVVLIARGYWRAIFWGIVWATLFCATATIVFGTEYWSQFFANTVKLRLILDSGELAYQQMSGFGFAQLLGASFWPAMILQIITAFLCLLVSGMIWRDSRSSWPVLMAVLLASSPMVSPYAFHYDAVMSAVAIFILFIRADRSGFLPAERLMLIVSWLAPISLNYLYVNFGFSVVYLSYMMLIFSCFRRYRADITDQISQQSGASSA